MKITRLIATIFVALLATLSLSGCITRYVDRVVTKTEYVVVAPEARYLRLSPVPAPPAKKLFTGDERPDFEELYKEQSLTLVETYQSIRSCNADKYAAEQDIAKKRAAHE